MRGTLSPAVSVTHPSHGPHIVTLLGGLRSDLYDSACRRFALLPEDSQFVRGVPNDDDDGEASIVGMWQM
jgi:hypothetical protein